VSASAHADEPVRDVLSSRIEIDGWLFVPTTADGAVETFAGFRQSTVTGANITTVWYRKSDQGVWESWAWEDQDQSQAIASIISILDLPVASDSNWPITPAPAPEVEPEPMSSGVLISDPFLEVIENAPDPDTMLEVLDTAGWSTAWIDNLMATDDCPEDAILDAMAAGIEYELATGENGAQVIADELSIGCLGICIPMTIRSDPVLGTWACGGWTVVKGPLPNGPGSEICHYERPATRNDIRVCVSVHLDCSFTVWTQTRAWTGTQTGRCSFEEGTRPVPGVPCNAGSAECSPNKNIDHDGWNP
jgi:hypothetical protein